MLWCWLYWESPFEKEGGVSSAKTHVERRNWLGWLVWSVGWLAGDEREEGRSVLDRGRKGKRKVYGGKRGALLKRA